MYEGMAKLLALVPENWDWLVRSNLHDLENRGKYFANITDKDFTRSLGGVGHSFKAFGDTPQQALALALAALAQVRGTFKS